MCDLFGPYTKRVLAFLAALHDLSPTDIGIISAAWRESADRERAEAWVRVHREVCERERLPILAAAAVARKEALDIARQHRWPDWPFWVAAADAGAAIAAGDRIGCHYRTLISPLAAAMPWLLLTMGEVRTAGYGVKTDGTSGVLDKGA